MSHDAINSWVDKAKNAPPTPAPKSSGVQVIKRPQEKTRGAMIMELAEKLRPYMLELFDGVRDAEGMLLQPANIRGISLNVAQNLLKQKEKKAS